MVGGRAAAGARDTGARPGLFSGGDGLIDWGTWGDLGDTLSCSGVEGYDDIEESYDVLDSCAEVGVCGDGDSLGGSVGGWGDGGDDAVEEGIGGVGGFDGDGSDGFVAGGGDGGSVGDVDGDAASSAVCDVEGEWEGLLGGEGCCGHGVSDLLVDGLADGDIEGRAIEEFG